MKTQIFRIKRCFKPLKIILGIASFVAIVSLTGCADEMSAVEDPKHTADDAAGYFLTLNITNPNEAATRSMTTEAGNSSDVYDNSDDRVTGTTDESTLANAHIYFAVENEIIVDLESDYIAPVNSTYSFIRIDVTNKINNLAQLAGKTFQIFIVGNTSDGINTVFTPNIINNDLESAKFSISSVSALPLGSFGTSGHIMPLVNAEVLEVEVPKESTETSLEAIKKMFSRQTATTAWWDINAASNPIKLERGVARLEYKDSDNRGTGKSLPADNHVYPIPTVGSNESHPLIKLYSMEPFNVNKESYLFRHTAKGNYAAADLEEESLFLFGKENDAANSTLYPTKGENYSWVATPWWPTSNPESVKPDLLNDLTIDLENNEYKINHRKASASDVLYPAEILVEKLTKSKTDYQPFYYVSENTLPNISIMEDYNITTGADGTVVKTPVLTDYATGVLFKFIVLDKTGNPLNPPKQIDDEEEEETEQEVGLYPEGVSKSDENLRNIYITDNDGKYVELAPQFAIIDGETQEVYILNYIACIVHNDGNQKATLEPEEDGEEPSTAHIAPMYYGIVRNNTYQIVVNGVQGLPLPKEPRSIFLSIDCKVLPWDVRMDDNVTLF